MVEVNLKLIAALLDGKKVSRYKIAEDVGISRAMLGDYANRVTKLESMSVANATKLSNYASKYYVLIDGKVIDRQFTPASFDFSADVLGKKYRVTSSWDVRSLIEFCNDLIDSLVEPFIFCVNNLLNPISWNFTLYNGTNATLTDYLFEMSPAKNKGIFEAFKAISVMDDDWNEWRNKGLTGECYFKMELLPRYADKAIAALNDVISTIDQSQKAALQLKEAEEKERELLLASHSIGKVYAHSETRIDANVVNNSTGEVSRMIIANVYDVGTFVVAERLKSEHILEAVKQLTEEEDAAGKWLKNYFNFNTKIRQG